ncbi:putative damage-inducible protein DinB [Nocardia sp. GAS34]|uniref:DinB family protein n=1 Tax=unclassified Nocardia TaxID=2637762 RepID=UPI003D215AAF
MTWTVPEVQRTRAMAEGGERETLQSWLDFHRATLLWKCRGLTAEQLKTRSVEPSAMSLLGLIRHMTEVEQAWFRHRSAGQEVRAPYSTAEHPDGDFDDLADADPERDIALFHTEIRLSDEAVATLPLEHTFVHPRSGARLSLRWVYQHMIEEYARHNGHADLLRERIDGVTGA